MLLPIKNFPKILGLDDAFGFQSQLCALDQFGCLVKSLKLETFKILNLLDANFEAPESALKKEPKPLMPEGFGALDKSSHEEKFGMSEAAEAEDDQHFVVRCRGLPW